MTDDPSNPSDERRGREARRTALKSGRIVYPGGSVECKLRNISDGGARLEIGGRQLLPHTFELHVTGWPNPPMQPALGQGQPGRRAVPGLGDQLPLRSCCGSPSASLIQGSFSATCTWNCGTASPGCSNSGGIEMGLARPALAFEANRRSAVATERSACARRRLTNDGLNPGEAARVSRHADPGGEGGGGRAPATLAMAMAAPERRSAELECHLAAQAVACSSCSCQLSSSFIPTVPCQHIIDHGIDVIGLDAGVAKCARAEAAQLIDRSASPPRLGRHAMEPA